MERNYRKDLRRAVFSTPKGFQYFVQIQLARKHPPAEKRPPTLRTLDAARHFARRDFIRGIFPERSKRYQRTVHIQCNTYSSPQLVIYPKSPDRKRRQQKQSRQVTKYQSRQFILPDKKARVPRMDLGRKNESSD